MKLMIDNLDGRGLQDYTSWVDATQKLEVRRRLNQPSRLQVCFVTTSPTFLVPANGARIELVRGNGQFVFTGYVLEVPKYEYLGWNGMGPVYRYQVQAGSDEVVLDRKTIRRTVPFVGRTAGGALRELTNELQPGVWDTSAIADVDTLPPFLCDAEKTWSQIAAEIGITARGAYRAEAGAIVFGPMGAASYALNEADADFSPAGLSLQSPDKRANDVTILGRVEPQSYVKDYFVGDGLSLTFYLSQVPFVKSNHTLVDEEYAALDPTLWVVTDPSHAVSVGNGSLSINGGTQVDGATTVAFIEKLELGGALILQHGDVQFNAASSGVIGGLYASAINAAGCLAGFEVSPAGGQASSGQSVIQALINGAVQGTPMVTQAGHRYVMTTRLYSPEIFRQAQTFHSSAHAAGDTLGGVLESADVRVVLEVHDIDLSNPASLAAPSTVLYDDVIASAPNFCTYATINAAAMFCGIAFTRMIKAVDTEVRVALPGANYETQLVGLLSEGADCRILSEPALQFYPNALPAANELIEVRYRGTGRAMARVNDPAGIAALQQGNDDGVRSVVRNVKLPAPRAAAECEQAALAVLDDSSQQAWTGSYTTWSDFLPGNASDLFPGDGLAVNVPSCGAVFSAVVREMDIVVTDLAGEHSQYAIRFANDTSEPLAMDFQAARLNNSLNLVAIANTAVGTTTLPDLTAAEITETSATQVTIDAGVDAPAGGGFEVRWSDSGWGQSIDRNLAGRFATRTFAVPRLARVQNYYVRQYDNSSPPRYSRYTAALHLDFPLT